jgi:hypothetical protein
VKVRELKEKLNKINDDLHIAVLREYDEEIELFEIEEVAVHSGTPSKADGEKAGFTFENSGPVTWLFLSIVES